MRAAILLACVTLFCASLPLASADEPFVIKPLPLGPVENAVALHSPIACSGTLCTWGYCSGGTDATSADVKANSDGVVVYVPAIAIFTGFYIGFSSQCTGILG
jgi:hypothetical protein